MAAVGWSLLGQLYAAASHYNRARGLSAQQAEQVVAAFRSGSISKASLARKYGVDVSMIKRLLRKHRGE